MKNQCIECKLAFTGRSDKKFCSDYCRNSFNNRRNSISSNYIRRINYALNKNRRILASYYSKGKSIIARNKLILEGYNFNLFTSCRKTASGKITYFCYDFGFEAVKSNFLIILSLQKTTGIKCKINYNQADED
jgi:hypothetical protein